jgi:hypothetical protein
MLTDTANFRRAAAGLWFSDGDELRPAARPTLDRAAADDPPRSPYLAALSVRSMAARLVVSILFISDTTWLAMAGPGAAGARRLSATPRAFML